MKRSRTYLLIQSFGEVIYLTARCEFYETLLFIHFLFFFFLKQIRVIKVNFRSLGNGWQMNVTLFILLFFSGTVICFTLFRFAGVSLTRQWNATTRIVFECFCTVFVWLVLTPQRHWVSEMNYTPVGVILLVLGFSAFYNFVFFRWLCQCPTIKCKKRENKELLLSEEQDGNVGGKKIPLFYHKLNEC